MSGKVQAPIHFFLHLNPQPVVVALSLAMPATCSQGLTPLPSPGGSNSCPLPASKGKAQDKVPLIWWNGSPAHAARTTRLPELNSFLTLHRMPEKKGVRRWWLVTPRARISVKLRKLSLQMMAMLKYNISRKFVQTFSRARFSGASKSKPNLTS